MTYFCTVLLVGLTAALVTAPVRSAENREGGARGMKRAGIGGMTVMEVDQGSPKGAVGFMSDEWRALFMHLVAEANRLGLEVNMNNDAGWNGSGAP